MRPLLVLILFLFSSCNAQEKLPFTKSLKIEYVSGDERYKAQEMAFILKGNEVFGVITRPNTNMFLSSEIKLNRKSIEILSSFLKLAQQYQNGCKEDQRSSLIQHYNIIRDKDDIRITKSCDWKGFDYPNLELQIFGSYLDSLTSKKQKLNEQLSTTLTGKWKENNKLENMNIGTSWDFSRAESNKINGDYFEILKNQKAILHRGNKKIYCDYAIDILDNCKYPVLTGDSEKNGKEFIYGHNFKIVEVSETKIKLLH